MTTKFLRHLLAGVLIAGLMASPAMAGSVGTTFIDFITDAGLLAEEQNPPGILTGADDNATMNKGVFSAVGTAWLSSSGIITATSTVSITIKLKVVGDTDANSADLCMFVQNANDPNDICTACFDGLDHDGTGILDPAIGLSINLGINFPACTNEYTLEYDPSIDRATLSRAATCGSPASVFREQALNGATSFYIGLFSTGGPIQLRQFTAIGADIPDFPVVGDPLDPANPWVNFGLTRGTGASTDPFDTLTEALAAPISSPATIHIVPGTDSTETFTGAGAIDQNVILVNSNPGLSVSIGVAARREADVSDEGFVSRGASRRR